MDVCVTAFGRVCMCGLSEKRTVYHVPLQAVRCPCTGHPHWKSIQKNRDYTGDDWPAAMLIPSPHSETFSVKLTRVTFSLFRFGWEADGACTIPQYFRKLFFHPKHIAEMLSHCKTTIYLTSTLVYCKCIPHLSLLHFIQNFHYFNRLLNIHSSCTYQSSSPFISNMNWLV